MKLNTKYHYLLLGLVFWALLDVSIVFSAPLLDDPENEKSSGRILARQAIKMEQSWITADHSEHKNLNKEFSNGPDVTKECLECHNQAALQFHKTIHWTWINPNTENEKIQIGKGGLTVNNFCISIHSNEPRCTSCHAGYGWKNNNFNFNDPLSIDCLVCHEQTGTYYKYPSGAGFPVKEKKIFPGNQQTYYPPDYGAIARSVSRPSRKNCGICHFFGGGGDGVKHGDLDSSLFKPEKNLDVHMGIDGQNFDCVRCHSSKLHRISGRIYSTAALDKREKKSLIEDDLTPKITCISCHGVKPHKLSSVSNDHTDKIACQTCHVPYFARVNPTKIYWDWSTAGKKKNGKPYTELGDHGKPVYMTKKGTFIWAKNVLPEYSWYNGTMKNITAHDVIDPSRPVAINAPLGQPNYDSKIFPFKIHRGKQPYDKINNKIVIPHLFPKNNDDKKAYWKVYDWFKAIEFGQEYAGLDYSGEYGFVETTYAYPITHMVSPKESALSCEQCHVRTNGRLVNINGVYIPGRDYSKSVDFFGWIAVSCALTGVMIHGIIRIFFMIKSKRRNLSE